MSVIDVSAILAGLRGSLAHAQAQLADAKSKAEAYQTKADAIGVVYESLKEKKTALKNMKRDVGVFRKTSYAQWKGNLWQNDYKTAVSGVESAYDTLIGEIDVNLDNLNLERTRYENLANEQWGLAGSFASTVNNIMTQIQNWTN